MQFVAILVDKLWLALAPCPTHKSHKTVVSDWLPMNMEGRKRIHIKLASYRFGYRGCSDKRLSSQRYTYCKQE